MSWPAAIVTENESTRDGLAGARIAFWCLLIFLTGLVLGALDPITLPTNARPGLVIGIAATQLILLVALSQQARFGATLRPRHALLVAFAASMLLAHFVTAVWPNSGDEYGYLYIADTLLHGRLWNETAPAPDIFDFFWIYEKSGVRVSQYPPGWPAVLAAFKTVGIEAFANPVLALATGVLLTATLRLLKTPAVVVAPLVAISMLSPFVLFNGSSFFPHMLTACAVVLICCFQLRDERSPSWFNKAAVGFAFSVALATRLEVFATVFVVFVAERLWRRKAAFLTDGLQIAAGALPVTAAFLAYNWAITGNPLVTTYQWVGPDFGVGSQTGGDPLSTIVLAAVLNTLWLSELFLYAGCGIAAAYVIALSAKLRQRRGLHLFDLIPVACVLFFFFFPHSGSHQFGARYWLFAWPPMVLTIATQIAQSGDEWATLARWRVHLPTFAALQIIGFAGTSLAIALLFRSYVDQRRAVYEVRPPSVPAVVLIPQREFTLSPWHSEPYVASSKDFARNSTDFSGSILYGRADVPNAVALACRLKGRTVYIWQDVHRLEQAQCPQSSAEAESSSHTG